jgi:hypothetical protein
MDTIFLRTGKLCHTGGHPFKWFDWKEGDSEAAYEEITGIFRQAELDYPNLGYMFPDEVGDFANETYDILEINANCNSGAFVFSFVGPATSGQTVMVEWPDEIPLPTLVTVDGLAVPDPEIRERRLVIILPALADGQHVVRVPTDLCGSGSKDDFPRGIVLFQNYPNPFNPSTTISFVLPERERVVLSVYNIEGRLVTPLLDATLDEGIVEVLWDGKDSRGNPMSSGVYFCRLIAGNETLTEKMVLLR